MTNSDDLTQAERDAAWRFGVQGPFCGHVTIDGDLKRICIEPIGHDPAHTSPLDKEP